MKKRNAGGEWTDTDRHRMSGMASDGKIMSGTASDGKMMSGTVIGKRTMTGMIGTRITIDDTNSTTGSTPPGIVSNGRNTADITGNPVKSTVIRRAITKNGILKKAATPGIRNKELQAANRYKTPRVPQDLPRVQQTMPNLAMPGKPTATTADRKAIIVTNAR